MAWEEISLRRFTEPFGEVGHYVAALACGVFVIALGRILAGRSLRASAVQQREDLEAVEHPREAPAQKHPDR
jgi:hypothetical protein